MKIIIDIPEKEFGVDIDDKFQDFFNRLKAEIKNHLTTNTGLVCGAYELETIDMFLKAFGNSTPLPKGHGDLIDRKELLRQPMDLANYPSNYVRIAPTIVEADAESEGRV